MPIAFEPLDVTITRIGAHGDGIADAPVGRLYVPLTAVGDEVRVHLQAPRGDGFAAEVIKVLTPSPARGIAPCRHFGYCGGCTLQHLTDDAYAAWKQQRIADALGRAGFEGFQLDPLVRTPPAARRRATFAVVQTGEAGRPPLIGFQMARGHHVVDLHDCPVLQPSILALLPALRCFLAAHLAPRQRSEVAMTLTDGGLDGVLAWPQAPDLALREALAAFAEQANLARLSIRIGDGDAEPIIQRRPVTIGCGAAAVPLPPGGFLQASAEGEAALVTAVITALAAARTAADLFAGVGTFTLPLAAHGLRVHAVDSERASLAALTAAARTQPGITCEERDLFVRPLRADELARFDAVVFDPPRAGARAQAEQLALSAVPRVVGVSCNPDTFIRDARILAGGGYRLLRVTPVDQFLWSAHLELVAVFAR